MAVSMATLTGGYGSAARFGRGFTGDAPSPAARARCDWELDGCKPTAMGPDGQMPVLREPSAYHLSDVLAQGMSSTR